MQHKIKLIKEDLSAEDLAHFNRAGIIAVDCEMMGLNINRDRLCMVQISDESNLVALVQIAQGQEAAPNLKKLLESNQVLKIFHFARTDLSWLKAWLGINVQNIFCTKIASKIARTYSDKHGLKDICKEVVGKELNKNQQSSDWGASEFNKDQMQYAAHDVIHLIPIHRQLLSMIKREGREDLLQRALNCIWVLVDLDILGYQGVLEH